MTLSGILFFPTILSRQLQSIFSRNSRLVLKHIFHRVDWREFDHFTEELQKRFLLSNLKTGNFVSLLKVRIFDFLNTVTLELMLDLP